MIYFAYNDCLIVSVGTIELMWKSQMGPYIATLTCETVQFVLYPILEDSQYQHWNI